MMSFFLFFFQVFGFCGCDFIRAKTLFSVRQSITKLFYHSQKRGKTTTHIITINK